MSSSCNPFLYMPVLKRPKNVCLGGYNICARSCPRRTPRLFGVVFNYLNENRFQIKLLWHCHFLPTGDTHITSDMCVGKHVSQGYTYHRDSAEAAFFGARQAWWKISWKERFSKLFRPIYLLTTNLIPISFRAVFYNTCLVSYSCGKKKNKTKIQIEILHNSQHYYFGLFLPVTKFINSTKERHEG